LHCHNVLIFSYKQLQAGYRHKDCWSSSAAMKKFLPFALLTMGLILNVGAQTTTTRIVAAPDPGSTAVLLGLGLAALAAWHRKTS
jgi:hypothetical protein